MFSHVLRRLYFFPAPSSQRRVLSVCILLCLLLHVSFVCADGRGHQQRHHQTTSTTAATAGSRSVLPNNVVGWMWGFAIVGATGFFVAALAGKPISMPNVGKAAHKTGGGGDIPLGVPKQGTELHAALVEAEGQYGVGRVRVELQELSERYLVAMQWLWGVEYAERRELRKSGRRSLRRVRGALLQHALDQAAKSDASVGTDSPLHAEWLRAVAERASRRNLAMPEALSETIDSEANDSSVAVASSTEGKSKYTKPNRKEGILSKRSQQQHQQTAAQEKPIAVAHEVARKDEKPKSALKNTTSGNNATTTQTNNSSTTTTTPARESIKSRPKSNSNASDSNRRNQSKSLPGAASASAASTTATEASTHQPKPNSNNNTGPFSSSSAPATAEASESQPKSPTVSATANLRLHVTDTPISALSICSSAPSTPSTYVHDPYGSYMPASDDEEEDETQTNTNNASQRDEDTALDAQSSMSACEWTSNGQLVQEDMPGELGVEYFNGAFVPHAVHAVHPHHAHHTHTPTYGVGDGYVHGYGYEGGYEVYDGQYEGIVSPYGVPFVPPHHPHAAYHTQHTPQPYEYDFGYDQHGNAIPMANEYNYYDESAEGVVGSPMSAPVMGSGGYVPYAHHGHTSHAAHAHIASSHSHPPHMHNTAAHVLPQTHSYGSAPVMPNRGGMMGSIAHHNTSQSTSSQPNQSFQPTQTHSSGGGGSAFSSGMSERPMLLLQRNGGTVPVMVPHAKSPPVPERGAQQSRLNVETDNQLNQHLRPNDRNLNTTWVAVTPPSPANAVHATPSTQVSRERSVSPTRATPTTGGGRRSLVRARSTSSASAATATSEGSLSCVDSEATLTCPSGAESPRSGSPAASPLKGPSNRTSLKHTGSGCEHISSWKRLRLKKGVAHFLCKQCGFKWRKLSSSVTQKGGNDEDGSGSEGEGGTASQSDGARTPHSRGSAFAGESSMGEMSEAEGENADQIGY